MAGPSGDSPQIDIFKDVNMLPKNLKIVKFLLRRFLVFWGVEYKDYKFISNEARE